MLLPTNNGIRYIYHIPFGGLMQAPGKGIRHRPRRRITHSTPPPTPPTIGRPDGRRRFRARMSGRGKTESAQGRIDPPPPLRRGVEGAPHDDAAGARPGNENPSSSRPFDRPGPIVTAATPPRKPPPVLRFAPAMRAMPDPCVRRADTTRDQTRRSGLRVGRVARANVTRPVKESATT